MSDQARITNKKDGSTFVHNAGDTVLRAALRAGVGMSYECNSGGCGGCKFELIEGEVDTLWAEAPGLSERDKQRGRHLACQCIPRGDITISAPCATEYAPPRPPQRQSARLAAVRDITHDIREFRFVAAVGANFLPGQYAMLDLPGVNGSRAYSLSNTANASSEWHFQIRRVPHGSGTKVLFDRLAKGDEVGLDGPYGVAYLRTDSARDLVCVAGGSGLAPMISIARGAVEAGMLGERMLYFFYGARTARDVCGEDMLASLEGFGDRIRFIPVVSQPGEGEQWTGATGYVHAQLECVLPQPLSNYEFYFAGPPQMTQALQELLMIGHKVPFGQIHFDRFF
ncbi:Ferredoxin:oxidoreductase FAD/NAD(P)-binding:oxidoreductase FAD-binding region [Thauera humireducens]|jgi:toluene monooxygenase electron transfer component|uniref:2Fe-2S iron-sulfur cluster-binding protein n=1 Tax=Thauera TaxID=33057 RepID=UPI0002D41B85|nr:MULTISPECIES: 2Fe-2S iron-sulfur cluster-binding protein [Thauera]CAH1746126.1 Ferredoxin:oxidoreductase FAD/NAD(P)-binding:oxidoreductase FAD-binding region [Thauera humireducens]